MMKAGTMMRRLAQALSIALLATACESLAPPPPNPLMASCLAPLRSGEPDPSVRDLVITVAGRDVSFTTCIVSQRHRRLAHARVDVAVAAAPSGEALAFLGDERANVSMVQDPIAGMPRLVVMVSRSTPWRGTSEVYPTEVRLKYQTCQDNVVDRCEPGEWFEAVITPRR